MHNRLRTGHTMPEPNTKGGVCHELPCQQVHRMHCGLLRQPLRRGQLLLPGQDPGGHPRVQPLHGSVHRLHVLPQKGAGAAAAFCGSLYHFQHKKGLPFFSIVRYNGATYHPERQLAKTSPTPKSSRRQPVNLPFFRKNSSVPVWGRRIARFAGGKETRLSTPYHL